MAFWRDEGGVAMIEATLGTLLLLFAALGAMQMVLAFHAALADHTAVTRAARTYAITGSLDEAGQTYENQRSSSFRSLKWDDIQCLPAKASPSSPWPADTRVVQCTARVRIPTMLPGGGLFSRGGFTEPPSVTETGYYPVGSDSGY